MMSTPEQRLKALGLTLPDPPRAAGHYLQAKRDGDHLHLSGHGPLDPATDAFVIGRVGDDVTAEQAHDAARLTGLQLLATMQAALGSLGAVGSVVRLLGMVRCAPGFTGMPGVIDGCSRLLLDVFGHEVGAHTRSAVGMAELPFGICVEVEALVAVR